jgi:hypothetical protein
MDIHVLRPRAVDSLGHWLFFKASFPVGWDRRKPGTPSYAKQRRKVLLRALGIEVQFQRLADPSKP